MASEFGPSMTRRIILSKALKAGYKPYKPGKPWMPTIGPPLSELGKLPHRLATGGAGSFMDLFAKAKSGRSAASAGAPSSAAMRTVLARAAKPARMAQREQSKAIRVKRIEKGQAANLARRVQTRAFNANVGKLSSEGWGGNMARIIARNKAGR